MTAQERKDRRRAAMLGVTIIVCESCHSTIDDANFTSYAEADDFAAKHQREDGHVLCDTCANPTFQACIAAARQRLAALTEPTS